MLKRLLVLCILVGLHGCVLPDNLPSSTNIPSSTTPLTVTEIVETPQNTLVPEDQTSKTPLPTSTATNLPEVATQTPEVRLAPAVIYRYRLQTGSPIAMMNFAHPEEGCEWMGVGGQIFDLSGNPTTNLIVKLTGNLNGVPIDLIALSGGALYLGPGGYEFKLSDHPSESSGALFLTLYDNQGIVISDPIAITTYSSCEQNFILVNFTQVIIIENGFQLYLPSIVREGLP